MCEFYQLISKFLCTFSLVYYESRYHNDTKKPSVTIWKRHFFLLSILEDLCPDTLRTFVFTFNSSCLSLSVTWQPGWHDTAPDPATTESDDLIAAQVLFVFTIHISKPTVFHLQHLEITSANSVYGLYLVNYSLCFSFFLVLSHIFSRFAKMLPVDTTCHFCEHLCTFVSTTMLHLSDS